MKLIFIKIKLWKCLIDIFRISKCGCPWWCCHRICISICDWSSFLHILQYWIMYSLHIFSHLQSAIFISENTLFKQYKNKYWKKAILEYKRFLLSFSFILFLMLLLIFLPLCFHYSSFPPPFFAFSPFHVSFQTMCTFLCNRCVWPVLVVRYAKHNLPDWVLLS